MNSNSVRDEVEEIKRRIRRRFPDARFLLSKDSEASSQILYLDVYTDAENRWDIQDLIEKPRLAALIKKQVLISVIPQPTAYLRTEVRNGNRARVATKSSLRAKRAQSSSMRASSRKRESS